MARVLDRLQAANMSDRGIQTWAQRVCEQIEELITDLQAQVTDIADALAAANAAQTAADDAAADATTAKTNDKLTSSYTSPIGILSAADVGATATITIAAHTRKYGDGTSVSVNGGTITGRAFSTKYYVYYDSPTYSGGSKTYVSTTNAATAQTDPSNGRHFVGDITTPADGGGSTSGGSGGPPWWKIGDEI